MIPYIAKKTIALFCSLLIIASLTFFLMKVVPGDPFSQEQSLRADVHELLRQQNGFHLPWYIQYRDYMRNVLQGELGYSFVYPERSVVNIIEQGFGVSAQLGLQAIVVALVSGILLGMFSVMTFNKWQDRFLVVVTTTGIALPSFLLAAFLQYTLAIYFPLFPVARWGTFAQSILPTLALSAAPMAFIYRLTRSGLLEVLQSEYIKLARAKGLPVRYWMTRHALPNALLPVISYMGPLIANVLIGSFIIEKIFSIPGLGQWFVNSVAGRDYPLIMGLTLFYSVLLLGAVCVVDIIYGLVDPRIRVVKRKN